MNAFQTFFSYTTLFRTTQMRADNAGVTHIWMIMCQDTYEIAPLALAICRIYATDLPDENDLTIYNTDLEENKRTLMEIRGHLTELCLDKLETVFKRVAEMEKLGIIPTGEPQTLLASKLNDKIWSGESIERLIPISETSIHNNTDSSVTRKDEQAEYEITKKVQQIMVRDTWTSKGRSKKFTFATSANVNSSLTSGGINTNVQPLERSNSCSDQFKLYYQGPSKLEVRAETNSSKDDCD